MRTHTPTDTYAHTHTHTTHTHTHTYIYMHTHSHTYVRTHAYTNVCSSYTHKHTCCIGLGCRMHRINLRRVRSWLPTSFLGLTLNCIRWWGFSPGALGNMECPFTAITPRLPLTEVITLFRILSMGQIELCNNLLGITIAWNCSANGKLYILEWNYRLIELHMLNSNT